jgi:cation transport regulator
MYKWSINNRWIVMPYGSIDELPNELRQTLPMHAQEVYKEAFNEAWSTYHDPKTKPKDISRTAMSDKIAWQAVEAIYTHGPDNRWAKKARATGRPSSR